MSNSERIIVFVSLNIIIMLAMLKYLFSNGIDLQNTRIIDHANDIWFVLDFIFYLIVAFLVDIVVLSWPSKNNKAISELIQKLEENKAHVKDSKNRRRKIA